MVHSMKEREQKLSSRKKPYFPNLRSAIISIAVVAFLLFFAGFAIDRNNVNRLQRYEKEAIWYFEQSYDQIEQRFTYAQKLVELIADTTLTDEISQTIQMFEGVESPQVLSELYGKMDGQLDILQRKIFTDQDYLLYAAYYEKIYACEKEMQPYLDAYNAKATYFNQQIGGFPALFAAKRLEMEKLELFSVASALKSRP